MQNMNSVVLCQAQWACIVCLLNFMMPAMDAAQPTPLVKVESSLTTYRASDLKLPLHDSNMDCDC